MTLEETVGPSHRLTPPGNRNFSLSGLAGQVVEFSGWDNPAGMSLAASLLRECQQQEGIGAWISSRGDDGGTLFFPPDFERSGVDCRRLPVLWAASAPDAFSIAEKLMRSRGFGMLVLDLTGLRHPRPAGGLGRLYRAARDSGCLALCLTRRRPGEASLDPMVFVHGQAAFLAAEEGGSYDVSLTVQKDKHHAPGRTLRRRYGSPAGLP